MRDAADATTPDLARRQAKAGRATLKERMGYQGPKVRACCANCRHFVVIEPEGPNQHPRERCGLGTFAVQRGAICGQHRRRP